MGIWKRLAALWRGGREREEARGERRVDAGDVGVTYADWESHKARKERQTTGDRFGEERGEGASP